MKKRTAGCFALVIAQSVAIAQQNPGTGDEVYTALQRDGYYVHTSAAKYVDIGKIKQAIQDYKPYNLKVLVVPGLGTKWIYQGNERRDDFAKSVFKKRLSMENGTLIVYTKKGISAYSDLIGEDQLKKLGNKAVAQNSKTDFSVPITWLATQIKTSKVDSATKTTNVIGLVGGVAAVTVIGIVGARAIAKNRSLKILRKEIDGKKQHALESISYLDSFDGLIPASAEATALSDYRARAYDHYESGAAMLAQAKSSEKLSAAGRVFDASIQDSEFGRAQIDSATGGTKIAYTVPPMLDPSADQARLQKAPLYAPVAGCCFFCSKPANNLHQVEMNLDGQLRTIEVCDEDLADLKNGQTPQMRGRAYDGNFVPWYMVQGYEPRSMYGTGSFIWDMLAFNGLMHMFNPFWSPYHIHSYYGGAGYYDGYNPNWFGGIPHNDPSYSLGGGDFVSSGDFGSSSGDFDFGGSDSGGGDWFSGDSGGSDFGGGGDFGGGDSGGGGGDW